MARKGSQVQGQPHDLSFGNLSIHDGRQFGGRNRHQSSNQDDYYRGGNHSQQENYQRSETGTERSYKSSPYGRATSGIPNQYGPMHTPKRPVFRDSDALSESEGSEVFARTVIPEDRQPHPGLSYEQARPSRGPPSVVPSMSRHKKRTKQDVSVAASELLPAISAPPGHSDFRSMRSDAGSNYGMIPGPGWPGHERSVASCNMSVAGSNSDWCTVDDFDAISVCTIKPDGKGPNTSWEDGYTHGLEFASISLKKEYWKGWWDGHKAGVEKALDEAEELRRKNGS